MRIGMEAATLSLKRIVDRIIILSGDTDLIPALEQFQKKCGREREPLEQARDKPPDGFDGLTASRLGAGEWTNVPPAHARSYVRVSGYGSV